MTNLQDDPPNQSRQATANQLGISPLTLDRWVKKNDFPAPIKLGSSRNSPTRWRQSTIDAWIAAHDQGVA